MACAQRSIGPASTVSSEAKWPVAGERAGLLASCNRALWPSPTVPSESNTATLAATTSHTTRVRRRLGMSGMAASAASSESRDISRLSVKRYYGELCSNIRATDDISFKLLGFVPLISGVGIIGVLSAREKLSLPSEAVALVAPFAPS